MSEDLKENLNLVIDTMDIALAKYPHAPEYEDAKSLTGMLRLCRDRIEQLEAMLVTAMEVGETYRDQLNTRDKMILVIEGQLQKKNEELAALKAQSEQPLGTVESIDEDGEGRCSCWIALEQRVELGQPVFAHPKTAQSEPVAWTSSEGRLTYYLPAYIKPGEIWRALVFRDTTPQPSAEDTKLLELLSELEWGASMFNQYGDAEAYCPSCENWKIDGHEKGCKLKAAIDTHQQPRAEDAKDAARYRWVWDKTLADIRHWIPEWDDLSKEELDNAIDNKMKGE